MSGRHRRADSSLPVISVTEASRQNQVAQLQRDIARINRRLSDLAGDESDVTVRIAQNERSVARTTNATAVQSHQREIRRLNDVLLLIRNDRARFARALARKTDELHEAQNAPLDLRQQKPARQVETLARDRRGTDAAVPTRKPPSAPSQGTATQARYDAFISHAHEDKATVALPLCDALQALGYRIWLDVFELEVGDNLPRSIDRGLAASRFGIVVLSRSFMAKRWTDYELNGLIARENASGKVVLPLWHQVSESDVLEFSPSLAAKFALDTGTCTIAELAQKFAAVLSKPAGSRPRE